MLTLRFTIVTVVIKFYEKFTENVKQTVNSGKNSHSVRNFAHKHCLKVYLVKIGSTITSI